MLGSRRPDRGEPRDRGHRPGHARAEGVHVPGARDGAHRARGRRASTWRAWRTTTAWTTDRSACRTRSRRRDASGFPIIGIGNNATEAFAPYRATIKGQRIAVIGATQVLDDEPRSRAGPRPTRRPGSRRPRTCPASSPRCRPRAPTATRWSSSCTGVSRRRPARARISSNWRARSSTPVPTSSSAGTRTAWKVRGRMDAAFVGYGLGNFAFYAKPGPGAQTGIVFVTATGRDIDSYQFVPGGDQQRRAATAERRGRDERGRGVERPARLHRPRALRSTTAVHLRRVQLVPRERRGVRHPVARRSARSTGSRSTSAAARRSARSSGATVNPSSCCSTAARRTRTPGTPSRSRSTGRSSHSTSRATGTRRIATTTRTGRRRTRSRSRSRPRALAPEARCGRRHVARRPHRRSRSPIARPISCARWCSST